MASEKKFPELVALEYDLAHDIYRQRSRSLEADALARKSNGEYYLYKVFGGLISSTALWLNPYWAFERDVKSAFNRKGYGCYLQIPVPANRTRPLLNGIFPYTTVSTLLTDTVSKETYRVWTGSRFELRYRDLPPTHSVQTGVSLHQYGTHGFVKDTTFKSRNPQWKKKIPWGRDKQWQLGIQTQGEYEYFYPSFSAESPTKVVESTSYQYHDYQSPVPENWSIVGKRMMYSGPCAAVDVPGVESIAPTEKTYCLQTLKRNLDSLVSRALPSRRAYNLFYQIGELKDLPQMLRQTLRLWTNLENTIGATKLLYALNNRSAFRTVFSLENVHLLRGVLGASTLDKDLADLYLLYKFGYESMWQAIQQLVDSPKKISRDINTQIAQNGKFMTLHSGIRLPDEEWASPPTINFLQPTGYLPDPANPPGLTATRTSIFLSCTICAGVSLPPIDEPRLRKSMFYDSLGLRPRPSDIYNLVPWTWLADWYLGIGQYLRVLEEIHLDPRLINYGMVTMSETLLSSAQSGWFMDTSNTYYTDKLGMKTEKVHSTLNLSASFRADYKLRVDVASLSSVKLTSGKGLNPYQSSILAALIAKFS